MASSGILAILFLIQSLWKPIFPWDFAKVSGFNPIGSAQALAVFLGGALVILIALINANQNAEETLKQKKSASDQKTPLKKIIPILAITLGILLFACIFLINFWAAWLGLIFGMSVIILGKLYSISLTTQNILKNFGIPLIILVIGLVFIFIRPVGNILNLLPEVSPTYQSTFDISAKTLMEGPKNFILGAGPATFGYKYSLYRSPAINLTDFWQVRFNQGAAVLPTWLATTGILGILAILFLMTIFFWQGFKSLISKTPQPKSKSAKVTETGSLSTQLSVFAVGFYFLILWFFYSANFSLFFAGFLMLGLFVSASNQRIDQRFINGSPQKAFGIMLACIVLIAGSVTGIYTMGQKYVGALNYTKGLQETELDQAIIKIQKAINLDNKDIYFRTLSQLYLFKINQVIQNQKLSQEERQKQLQQNIFLAEGSALRATRINPADSLNWLQLGSIYENFNALNIQGASESAILNYQKAQELDPQNPQIPFNLGRIYFVTNQLDKAREETQKSLQLKPDFQPTIQLMDQIERPGE